MSIIGTVIFVLLSTIILNFLFKKYNILIDQVNISKHKNYNLGRDDLNIKNEFKNFKQIIKYVSTKSLNPITFGGSIKSIFI